MWYDTVINYCTIDDKFIRENVRQCLYFSKDIYIIAGSHFFDGTPEDEEKMESLKEFCRQFPNVHLIRFKWESGFDSRYWHNYTRWIGIQQCSTEYIMFMDADEIFEGEIAYKSLSEREFYNMYDEYVFSCYWYFREPSYRSREFSVCHKLIRRSLLTKEMVFSKHELGAIGMSGRYKCMHNVKYNGKPFLHHFSWVRTKDEMLQKTSSWGHRDDKNWRELVEEEFSRPFNGKDFEWGYEYDIVDPIFEF